MPMKTLPSYAVGKTTAESMLKLFFNVADFMVTSGNLTFTEELVKLKTARIKAESICCHVINDDGAMTLKVKT